MNREKREDRLTNEELVSEAEEMEESSMVNPEEVAEQQEEEQINEDAPLFQDDKVEDFRSRWESIQTSFVDDPKDSVQKADKLVAEVIKSIVENFSKERSYLESHWKQGSEVSTEGLRVALTRYRSFFSRLLEMN